MVTNSLTEDFLVGLKGIEESLAAIHFYSNSFKEKGYACFATYKKEDTIVEFLFGPSDWDVEMIVFTLKGKFALKDLLEMPLIIEWVYNNKYKKYGERKLKNELFWFVELLKVALPIIE